MRNKDSITKSYLLNIISDALSIIYHKNFDEIPKMICILNDMKIPVCLLGYIFNIVDINLSK